MARRPKARQTKPKDKGNGKHPIPSSDPRVLALKLESMEKSLESFSATYNKTVAAFSKAFYMTDAHMQVLKWICQDIANGTLLYSQGYKDWKEKFPEDSYPIGDDVLDMPAYYDRYNKMMAAKAKEVEEAEAKKEDPEKADEVFGGDVNGQS